MDWNPNQIGTVNNPMYFLYGNSDKLLSERANRLHCVQALNVKAHISDMVRLGAFPNKEYFQYPNG